MKCITAAIIGIAWALILIWAMVVLCFSDAYGNTLTDIVPNDKDTILTPIVGNKVEDGIVPKTEVVEPPAPQPLTDVQAQKIRSDWESALGIDIWQPYYMFQDFENMLRNHLKIKLGPFTGKPYFNYKEKSIEYRFVWRF